MAQAGKMYDSFHEYDANLYQPSDRIYVRSSVRVHDSEVDPRSGLLKQDSPSHRRTQALRAEGRQLDSDYDQMQAAMQRRSREKGQRVSIGSTLMVFFLLALFLGVCLLVQQGILAQKQRMLASMNKRIEAVRAENRELEAKIAEASDAATICYAAARNLGLVPADSTQAIELTALETRPQNPGAVVNASANAQPQPDAAAAPGQ